MQRTRVLEAFSEIASACLSSGPDQDSHAESSRR